MFLSISNLITVIVIINTILNLKLNVCDYDLPINVLRSKQRKHFIPHLKH